MALSSKKLSAKRTKRKAKRSQKLSRIKHSENGYVIEPDQPSDFYPDMAVLHVHTEEDSIQINYFDSDGNAFSAEIDEPLALK